eukprot:1904-Heterococcus_DN1.PRE.8
MHNGAASSSTSNEDTHDSLALLLQYIVKLIMTSIHISASDARTSALVATKCANVDFLAAITLILCAEQLSRVAHRTVQGHIDVAAVSTVEKPQYARCGASRGVCSVKGAQHAGIQLALSEKPQRTSETVPQCMRWL